MERLQHFVLAASDVMSVQKFHSLCFNSVVERCAERDTLFDFALHRPHALVVVLVLVATVVVGVGVYIRIHVCACI
jgi:hypothetical protein